MPPLHDLLPWAHPPEDPPWVQLRDAEPGESFTFDIGYESEEVTLDIQVYSIRSGVMGKTIEGLFLYSYNGETVMDEEREVPLDSYEWNQTVYQDYDTVLAKVDALRDAEGGVEWATEYISRIVLAGIRGA